MLARRSGAVVTARFADAPACSAADFDAALAEIAWMGMIFEGESLYASAHDRTYRTHIDRLVATGAAIVRDGETRLALPPGQTTVDDAVRGAVTFENSGLGDIVLVHANGLIDEHVAAALDDALQETPMVVHDDRHLEHTARALLVIKAAGLTPPRYAHVGALLPDEPGGELPTIGSLRRAGYLAGAVVEHLLRLGWTPPGEAEPLRWSQLIATFSLERVGHAPAHYNQARLRALNARTLRALPAAELAALVARAMQRANLLEDPIPAAAQRWIQTFIRAYGETFTTLGEALALVADLRAEAVMVPALELEKLRNRQVVFYLDAVGQYVDAQPELRDLPLDADLAAIGAEFGIAHDDAFAAVRMALTGNRDGAPLGLLFPLLGHDRILIRIGAISSHLLHGRGLEPIAFGPGGVPFQTIQPTRPPAD